QTEPLGAHAARHEARARYPDLSLRRARDDRAIGGAHHDIADAQRRAAGRVALDLGAAYFHLMARAEIFLDCRREPRGRPIERDGAVAEPPPQRENAKRNHPGDARRHIGELAQSHPGVSDIKAPLRLIEMRAPRRTPLRTFAFELVASEQDASTQVA